MSKITMLCGLPGSGKSTWANQNKRENTIILSSDKIREELFGAEEIQGNPKQVFNLLYKRAEEALKQEKNVIIDSTNLSRANREKFIKRFYPLADFLYQANLGYMKYLDSIDFPYTYRESDGGHIWRNWRLYLSEFAPMLWK